MIKVRVVGPIFWGIGWTFNEVMNLTPDAGLVKVYLNVPGIGYLLASGTAGDFLAYLLNHADRDEMVTGSYLRSEGRRAWFNCLGDHSLRGIRPGHAIPRRSLFPHPLTKVTDSPTNHHRR